MKWQVYQLYWIHKWMHAEDDSGSSLVHRHSDSGNEWKKDKEKLSKIHIRLNQYHIKVKCLFFRSQPKNLGYTWTSSYRKTNKGHNKCLLPWEHYNSQSLFRDYIFTTGNLRQILEPITSCWKSWQRKTAQGTGTQSVKVILRSVLQWGGEVVPVHAIKAHRGVEV